MIGKTIGHYRVLEKLGQGGMGVVYLAEDVKLKRNVALKFLPAQFHAEAEEKRFINEAQVASALDHPNICAIHEIDETDDGQMFIVMAHYEGETLKERIERGPLPPADALAIAAQLAEGLHQAHRQGIIHRDIKPANIMITPDGVVKILDFGLARLKGQTRLTRSGTTVGTLAYASPELLQGQTVDARTDIWSLGVVLYEMLTGQLPFRGDYEQAMVYAIINDESEPVTALCPEVPIAVDYLLDQALAKAPDRRYPDLVGLRTDLQRILDDVHAGLIPASISTPPAWTPPRKKGERRFPGGRRVRLAALLLTLVSVLALGWWGVYNGLLAPPAQPPAAPAHSPPGPGSGTVYTIVVYPFIDASQNQDRQPFCFSLADHLVHMLDRIPPLEVKFDQASPRPDDLTVNYRENARKLDADAVLLGSLSGDSQSIRLSVRLVRVADGTNLWAQEYREAAGRRDSFFAIQEKVALAVADALEITLAPRTMERWQPHANEHSKAFEYFQKGTYYIQYRFSNFHRPEDFQKGIDAFQKALEIEPDYALAYVGLFLAYAHRQDPNDADKQSAAAERAYTLDPNLPETKTIWAAHLYFQRGDREAAVRLWRESLRQDPDMLGTHQYVGLFLMFEGLYPQAMQHFALIVRRAPIYLFSRLQLARCYYLMGDFENARIHFHKATETAPGNPGTYLLLIRTLLMQGRVIEAERTWTRLQELKLIPPGHPALARFQSMILARRGERVAALALDRNFYTCLFLGMKDEALSELEKMLSSPGAAEFHYLMLANFPLDLLRGDPRFQAILARQKQVYERNLSRYGDM